MQFLRIVDFVTRTFEQDTDIGILYCKSNIDHSLKTIDFSRK
jgi:hypothetical protein